MFYNIFPVWVCREDGVVIPCFKVIERSNFFGDLAILGSTPNDEISESKKVLVLLSKRFLISGVILGSVINRPKNKSFLVATSDSIEFRLESFSSKRPDANSGTLKICLRNQY